MAQRCLSKAPRRKKAVVLGSVVGRAAETAGVVHTRRRKHRVRSACRKMYPLEKCLSASAPIKPLRAAPGSIGERHNGRKP